MPGPEEQFAAMRAAAEAFALAEMESALEWRLDQLRFAGIFCCCYPYWTPRAEDPPHAGCPVHSVFMITPDGTVV